ncbi:MAG: glycosyltransferase family 4 protein [Bacteroidales bacterium]|nr:glycosyltransferase family 4 protein [Bacteroidales bacterium]
MNILYICDTDPRSASSGAEQRTNFLWNALKEQGDVYTIRIDIWDREDNVFFDERIYNDCLTVPIKGNNVKSYVQKIQDYLEFKFGFLNLCIYSRPIDVELDSIYDKIKFDVIVCRYIVNVARYKLWKYKVPILVDFDDHYLQVLKTNALPIKNSIFVNYMVRQFVKLQLRFIEKKIYGGWVSNETQLSLIKTKTPVKTLKNILVNPSINYKYLKEERKDYLFTIGYMGYKPNYEGVDFFVNKIWPSIHNKFTKLKYFIGGMNAPQDYVERWNSVEGVEYLGFVENLEELYEGSIASVVPIYSGGGTCIKTLESFAYSRVCISSPFGARGLEKYFDSKDIGLFIYNDSSTFIKILEEEIFDKAKRQINETNAKNFVDKNYSYEKFKESVKNVLGTIKE